jgi:putative RNA 2'-phosphotransferase
MSDTLKHMSKFLSLVLRHEPQEHGLMLDDEGYVPVEDVLALMGRNGIKTDMRELSQFVDGYESGKKRFSIMSDGHTAHIRANYGHSVKKLAYVSAEPPAALFHGTTIKVADQILHEGLKPMGRQYVHLAVDPGLALRVGSRHGRPIVLQVDSAGAYADGVPFFRANENFWLVESLPGKFLWKV